MTRCPICKSTALRPTEEPVTLLVPLAAGPLSLSVEGVPARRCTACGEGFFEGRDLERAELLAATELSDRGLREGAVFRFMRKAVGLRAADLAGLLDLTPETISRWENDRSPIDRAAWATVAAMATERSAGKSTTLDRLGAAAAPRDPPRALQLRFRR